MAARWKDLGLALKIPEYHLNNIEADYAGYPSRSVTCCKAMFKRWIQSTVNPTWDTLQKAIDNLPRLSEDGSFKSKSNYCT